jgi:transposase
VNKPFTDIDGKALGALITRVSEAKENNLALIPDDCQLLLDALVTLVSMQERLANHDVTVHKLLKSSEKLGAVLKQTKASSSNKNKKRNNNNDKEGFTPVKPTVTVYEVVDVKKATPVLSV